MLDSIVTELAIPILGSIWAFIQASKWWQRRVNKRIKKALKIIRAGVAFAYKHFYKEHKKKNTVTEVIKERAMQIAREEIQSLANIYGIDINTLYPKELLIEEIEKAIMDRKGRKAW